MSFLNPTLAIVGLVCVGIPILIHILFRRKRRPISWGAMQFLMQAYKQQRKKTNLEQMLLLASRCLLVLLLALAFGKPILGALAGENTRAARTLYILLDNSIASRAILPSGGTTLDAHKARAKRMVGELSTTRGDRVGLVLLAGPAQAVVSPASIDLSQVSRLIENATNEDARADIPRAMDLVRQRIADDASKGPRGTTSTGSPPRAVVALLSDLREGSADIARALPEAFAAANAPTDRETPQGVQIIAGPVGTSGITNLGIAAVEPARSLLVLGEGAGGEQNIAATVRIVRSGPAVAQTTALHLWATTSNAVRKSEAPWAIPSSATKGIIAWTQGQKSAEVSLAVPLAQLRLDAPGATTGATPGVLLVARIDADTIESDNVFVRPLISKPALRVAMIGGTAVASTGPAGTPTEPGTNTTGPNAPSAIDQLSPADWLSLGLAPESQTIWSSTRKGVVIVPVAPDQLTGPGAGSTSNAIPAALRDMGAIVLADPGQLDALAWSGVRAAVNAGALLMVFPSASQSTQLWTDAFKSAMGVDWQFAREVKVFEGDGAAVSTDTVIGSDADANGPGAQGSTDMLALLRAELPDLTRSVNFRKALPVQAPPGAMSALLTLRDGTPVVCLGSAGSAAAAPIGTTQPRLPTTPPTGGTIIYVAASPTLSWTDLPVKPLFVPLVQELLRQGVGKAAAAGSMVIAGQPSPTLPRAAKELALVAPIATGERATNQSGSEPALRSVASLSGGGGAVQPISRAASVWSVRGEAGVDLAEIAVNADAGGASMNTLDAGQAERWLAGLGAKATLLREDGAGAGANTAGDATAHTLVPGAGRETPPISLPLLIAAGVLAVFEMLLARFFSHAKREPTPILA